MFRLKDYIRADLKREQDKDRDFQKIRQFFDMTEKKEYTIDDITWNDLEMDNVFSEVDRTYTTIGEEVLYNILRNPIMDKDKLNKRDELIDLFIEDNELMIKIRYILFKLGFDKKNRLLEMISGTLIINKVKYYLYTFLGKVLPIVLIGCAILFKDTRFMLAFMVNALVNCGISSTEERVLLSSGINYLRDIIVASKKLCIIDNEILSSHINKMKKINSELKSIDRGTFVISACRAFGGLFGELFATPFLIEESTYYKISKLIDEDKGKIYELMYIMGEIDALVGLASYKMGTTKKITKPEFIDDKKLIMSEAIYPLLEKPVANSITIDNKGIILTGTNMSGKSTFLRTVGVNILLAQTLDFTFTNEYKAGFFNVVTSISLKDDISSGKSYYLTEVEAIHRVIEAVNKDIPVFTLIDEIFRGTNPIERISSSAEILSYINKRNAIVIAATHDREIADMLEEEYSFYHFSENVDSKEGLTFDYKIKQGVSRTRNAIKLLEYMGYPKEIISKAYARCEEIQHYV